MTNTETQATSDYLTRAQDIYDMDERGISPAAVAAPGAESPLPRLAANDWHQRDPWGRLPECYEWCPDGDGAEHLPGCPDYVPTTEDLNELDLWAERDYRDHMEMASR